MEPMPFLWLLWWPTNPAQPSLLPKWPLLNGLRELNPQVLFSFSLALLAAPAELGSTHHGYFLAGISHI